MSGIVAACFRMFRRSNNNNSSSSSNKNSTSTTTTTSTTTINSSSSNSSSRNSKNSNPAAGTAGPTAGLALFFKGSRRDVKPRGSVFLELVPSFSGMVFLCGEGYVLEACRSSSRSKRNRYRYIDRKRDPEGTLDLGTNHH